MSELIIDNPIQTISYSLSWTEIKKHILKVIATFPKEYSLIKDEDDKIILLNIPLSQANRAIAKDQIIYVDNITTAEQQTTLKIVLTNEDNKISSYTELERDKKSLNVFTILLKKSIEGTLGKAVANLNAQQKPKVDAGQAFIQILLLIVALIAVFYGFKVLLE